MDIFLLPQPQKLETRDGFYTFAEGVPLQLPEELSRLKPALETLGAGIFTNEKASAVHFYLLEDRSESLYTRQDSTEATYTLEVAKDGIAIGYNCECGAFYALMTLRQLIMQARQERGEDSEALALPCVNITDYPGLKNRAYMLDISRGKVPLLSDLKEFIDLLASLKYNQLQLYMEGFSFMYASFDKYCDEKSALTPEEIQALDIYCRERLIELVPNQNSYGHMGLWLAQPEFRMLAEAPDGWKIANLTLPPTTLDARNDDCMVLLEKMCSDLLPNFISDYFNVDMDEPFDMGLGNNMKFAAQNGREQLYLIHAKKMYQLVSQHGKTMMMWGDVVEKYPSLLKELPEDIIIMDWGYEAEFPVDRHARLLKENGRRFFLCPGTNSWSSYTGMTENMIGCIKSTVDAAYKYGAEGVMLTDWGDGGHLQYLPVSYAPTVFAAALIWNPVDVTEDMLARALDLYVFEDTAHLMGKACLDAGNYVKLEEFSLPCRTMASTVLETGRISLEAYTGYIHQKMAINNACCQPEVLAAYPKTFEERKPLDVAALTDYIDSVIQKFTNAYPTCPRGALIKEEYTNALTLIKLLTRIRKMCLDETIKPSAEDIESIEKIISNHKKLWLARNKESGLPGGMKILEKIRESLQPDVM